MSKVFPGRYAAQSAEPFVVLLIGMRVNRILALRRWTRVAAAMPPMIAELKKDPALGLLHVEFFVYWRGVAVVQYWRSFEQLHAYAHARDAKHLPAWAEFNRRIGSNGAVGIWPYVNMPRFGLGAAAEYIPATGRLENASSRIQRNVPAESNPDQKL